MSENKHYVRPLGRQLVRPPLARAVQQIYRERLRQNAKWPGQQHPPAEWHLILSEEMGELAQAILRESFPEDDRHGDSSVKTELIHVAAVAFQWLERIEEAEHDAIH